MIIETPFVKLELSGGGFRMTYGLKVWETTGDPPAKDGDPVIDTEISTHLKHGISDMTPNEIVNRGLAKDMLPLMQKEIDKYLKLKQALAVVDFAEKETALAGGLNG